MYFTILFSVSSTVDSSIDEVAISTADIFDEIAIYCW